MWTVDWRVTVNGTDMTSAMQPYLVSLEVKDKAGEAGDSCSLSLDDTGGQIALPSKGAAVVVALEGVTVFTGVVDRVRSSGSRGGGRMLQVDAKGFDTSGKAKEPLQMHQDDGTVGDFMQRMGQAAGYTVKVADDLASISRSYMAADGESFLHYGQRLARELGGTFKLRGSQAVLAKRGADAGLPSVTGTVGEGGNVISWDITPVTGRRKFSKARVRYFDRENATFQNLDVDIDSSDEAADAVNVVRTPAADKAQAEDIANARKEEAAREGGEGSAELDLAPTAQAEALFVLTGARPGVDGTYRIVSVTHRASRSSGSTTSLELKQPTEGAGTDTRE